MHFRKSQHFPNIIKAKHLFVPILIPFFPSCDIFNITAQFGTKISNILSTHNIQPSPDPTENEEITVAVSIASSKFLFLQLLSRYHDNGMFKNRMSILSCFD